MGRSSRQEPDDFVVENPAVEGVGDIVPAALEMEELRANTVVGIMTTELAEDSIG
jgi:hypothetical protein